MGLTQSAILLPDSDHVWCNTYEPKPLEQLTEHDIDVFLNDDVLLLIQEWSMTKNFCSLLATQKRLWKKAPMVRKETVRVYDIVNLSYWNTVPVPKEVVLFCGDEAFISTKKKHPFDVSLFMPSLVFNTANDNALLYLIRSFRLKRVSLRIEFILDDISIQEFNNLNSTADDYNIIKDYILSTLFQNKPKELEIVILDRRGEKRERITYDKIVYFQDTRPFLPVRPQGRNDNLQIGLC